MDIVTKPKMNKEVKLLIKEAITSSNTHNRYEICEKLGELLQERYYDEGKKIASKDIKTTNDLLERIDIVMIEQMQTRIKEGNYDG